MVKHLLALLLLLPAAVPASEIRGRVTDEAGKPIAGAEVHVHLLFTEVVEGTARSNAGGDFVFGYPDEPEATLYGAVVATAPGRALAGCWLTDADPSPVLRLHPARTATGRALCPDGTPAAGVDVRLAGVEAQGQIGGSEAAWVGIPGSLSARFTTHTDGKGTYRLPGMPPGKLRLILRDPRFLQEETTTGDQPEQVHMRAGCRVRGRLALGATGLAGWRVSAVTADGNWLTDAPTDATGAFLLYGFGPADLVLFAEPPKGQQDPGCVAAVQRARVTADQPDAEANLAAEPGVLLAGRTLDAETREPLPQVILRVRGRHRPPRPAWAAGLVTSGPDGAFAARVLPGKVSFTVARPGLREPGEPEDTTEVAIERSGAPVEALVRDWPVLRGSVADENAHPVAGAMVAAEWGGGVYERVAGRAAADGSFLLSGFTKGEVRVSARKGDLGMTGPLTLKPPYPARVALQIGPVPRLTYVGRVVDDRGRPAAGVGVQLWESNSSSEGGISTHVVAAATTDARGRYRFVVRGLTGTYSPRVAGAVHRQLSGGDPVGDAGPERRLTDLVVVSFDAAVTGRVLDAQGRPVAHAVVFWPAGTPQHRVVADAAGRFRLPGVPDRAITLAARDPDGKRSAFVRAAPGREATITLTP